MKTHQKTGTPAYLSWYAMKQRCRNPNYGSYKNYGAKGVDYCDEWEDFESFFRDMGERPKGTTLDRIDSSKGYSPENCRWANSKTQNENRKWLQSNNTTGSRGVYYLTEKHRKKKWRASINRDGKRINIGTYLTKEEADNAWWKEYNVRFEI